ncbi:MAG: MoaD/ThiS family protein [Candidatus Bipolaricaulaceae bacterium]
MEKRWRPGRVYFFPVVTLRRRDKVLTAPAGKSLERILREAGILPDTVLVVREGKIVPLDYRPQDGEEFELIDVISGG